ncbi:hypothetical protein HK099_000197 [Clydaea vesicula]|uniref:Plasma membrane ATPase n=1 Tax=Clydaea vesicula TaxID=447962 RepID=A0AAD5TZN6_9FUNG|nr:hypothetical protein HK099_000197 [Clydaea vesicula]
MAGLNDSEVAERLLKFGHNEIKEKKHNPILKFLGYFTGTISVLIEIAAIVAFIVRSYEDFAILAGLLVINACVGFIEEAKAENALDALKNTLALNSKVFRNGSLVEIESVNLVPGDVIALRLGDIIPADCRLLGITVTGEISESPLQIDQSALTGESLPVSKGKGSIAYSSSICKQGQMLAIVTKTGVNTFIGRAANLISITTDAGHFQKVINNIGNFLVIITVVMAVTILLINLFVKWQMDEKGHIKEPRERRSFNEALLEVLSLTIAAIPVGLPTVLSVTMAVGASQLAKKEVIVKRLTAIEELASVSILCSDKTGTLTLNKLSFDEPYLANKGTTATDFVGTGIKNTAEELLLDSYFASEAGAQDPIEFAIRNAAESRLSILQNRKEVNQIPGFRVTNFIPFNPNSKYTEAKVTNLETGEVFRVIKGAPQVVIRMCGGHKEASDAVIDLALRGVRALGVARTIDPEMTKFEVVGMIALLDPPRHDSADTIKECKKLGVSVKMITGDQMIIGKEVAARLGMDRTILDATNLNNPDIDIEAITDCVVKADGFAQVIPEDKYKVVELLQNRGYLVAMTGDGVNDAPALKKANVGIAVEGCTDAARSAADIVLLAAGLSTIVDGIKASRAIFQRMRSYALYRIASTIHFLLFFFFSILFYDFVLPNKLILMICILNDAATLVISVDNAKINKRPDKWRLGQLMTLSTILGILLCVISFGHFFVAKYVFTNLTHGQIQTIMYLQISSCPHFVIFSTRLTTHFWKNMPSTVFIVAIGGTQVIAMVMSIVGWKVLKAEAIGWEWGFSVMAVSLVSFMLLDFVKVWVINSWSFELTAKLWPVKSRKMEVDRRRGQKIVLERVKKNFGKIKILSKVIHACALFKHSGERHLKK